MSLDLRCCGYSGRVCPIETKSQKQEQELKLLKAAFRRTQESADRNTSRLEALQSREELLAILSHELKNPLTALSMISELLDREQDFSKKGTLTQRLSQTIKTAVQQMLTLTSDLIDLNKLEEGHIKLDVSLTSLCPLIDSALLTHSIAAESKWIQFEKRLSPDHLSVFCDPSRILQVISNLLGNAIKFSPPGGVIRIETTSKAGQVILVIRDQGCGIDPEQIPHLFKKFWQAKKENHPGYGLGLFISKKIIDAHHGQIWVESNPLEGSAFYVSLPGSLPSQPNFYIDQNNDFVS